MDKDYEEYIKEGFLKSIGKLPDYKIILNSAGYYDRGVLTREDILEIKEAIEQYNQRSAEETIEENEPVEEEQEEQLEENTTNKYENENFSPNNIENTLDETEEE